MKIFESSPSHEKRRTCFIAAVALFLAACAGGNLSAQNTARGDLSSSDFPAIKKSFDAASKIKLGTYQDIREIDAAILRDDSRMTVKEIRWISPVAVVVYAGWYGGPLDTGTYYYTLGKDDIGWRVMERYLYSHDGNL